MINTDFKGNLIIISNFKQTLTMKTQYILTSLIIILGIFPSIAQNAPVLVKDIKIGAASSNPTNFTTFGNKLRFQTSPIYIADENWESDGTSNGTVSLGAITAANAAFSSAVLKGNNYTLQRLNDTTLTLVKNGTTVLKKFLNQYNKSPLYAGTDVLYFVMGFRDSSVTYGSFVDESLALWRSDGTEQGTVQVGVLVRYLNVYSNSYISGMASGNAFYYVLRENEVCQTLNVFDGSEIKNIERGCYPVFYSLLNTDKTNGIYFSKTGDNGTLPTLLFRYTNGQTIKLSDSNAPLSTAGSVADKVILPVSEKGLWLTDGTINGTKRILSNPTIYTFKNNNGDLLAVTNDGGYYTGNYNLWRVTNTNAFLINNLVSTPTSYNNFLAIGNTLYFNKTTAELGNELWKQDVSVLPNAPQSCISKSKAPWELWILNVKLNTINNTSEKFKDYSTAGYSDYTNLSTSIQKGQTYLLNVTPALSWSGYLPNVYCRTWIDWNNNAAFEDTELVFQNTNVNLFQSNIRVPSSAISGSVRMRIAMKWGSYPTACETFEKGEVEDYTLQVSEPIAPSGKDTLRISSIQGDTQTAQGGQIRLEITLRNTGTAPSDPNTPLSIFQNQQPWAFKGPVSTCFKIVSNSIPIGRIIQPNETVTMPFVFTMSDSFTHISPLAYPPITFGATNVTIGDRGAEYCIPLYYNPIIDTLYNFHTIKSTLNDSDLAVEIVASDTTYTTIEGIFNFTVKMTNKGNFNIKNARTVVYTSPHNGTPVSILQTQKGSVQTAFHLGEYFSVWNVPNLNMGESVTMAVRVQDTFMAPRLPSIVAYALASSNQINDLNANNNSDNQQFTQRTTPSPDLVLSNLNISTPSVQQGQILNFKVDIKNIGLGNATNNFKVKAYISKDNILSADDVQDGVIPTGNFVSGFAVTQVPGASTIPLSLEAGQYYLILKVDADNEIGESNEDNNVLVSTTTFTVPNVLPGNNCISKSKAPWELWISKVSLNTINNASEKLKDYSTLGYSDYSNISTTLEKGKTYPLSITPSLSWTGNLPNAYCMVWIDFNNNKGFEDNEIVLSSAGQSIFTSNVLIPSVAVVGTVKMRIALKWGAYPFTCETFDRGEVEDYNIIIQEGISSCNPLLKCPKDTIVLISDSESSYCNSLIESPTIDLTGCNLTTSNLWNNRTGCLPIGTTGITWTMNFTSGGFTQCTYNVTVSKSTIPVSDLALSLTATPSVYRQWTTTNFKIAVKNSGNQVFMNIKIKFPFPDKTVTGGAVTPSIGKWNEWCSGGIKCYEWIIPTLAANTTATLDIPLFILDALGTITTTAQLSSSTPLDDVTSNNSASVTITPALAQPQALAVNRPKPTELIPVVIQGIYPTLTEGDITVLIESNIEKEVQFDFYNTLGKSVKTEVFRLEKGMNHVKFDFWNQQNGLYIIQTSEGQGKFIPQKFIKI